MDKYIKPTIEVYAMELEQAILGFSTTGINDEPLGEGEEFDS